MIEGYPEIFTRVEPKIRKSYSILDIGPGIRPQPFFRAEKHICVEPHYEYGKVLEGKGYIVWTSTAVEGLLDIDRVDTIFMLDVIEHMEKKTGENVLELAKKKSDQIVVFTPMGFKEQSYKEGEKDAWGMNGARWQTHKSGWTPEDFKGWDITKDDGCFFAIWG
jgi:hypothetical protein